MSMTGFSGSDDVLACFAAGNAFSWDDWFREETEEAHFQEVIDMLLNLSVFVYIGTIIVSAKRTRYFVSVLTCTNSSRGENLAIQHLVYHLGVW